MISGVGARDAFRRSAISNFDPDFWYAETREAGESTFDGGLRNLAQKGVRSSPPNA